MMARQTHQIKTAMLSFRTTNDFKARLHTLAQSVGATDGEFCREAVKELSKAITESPDALRTLRMRFQA
jgi:hypothetical protein